MIHGNNTYGEGRGTLDVGPDQTVCPKCGGKGSYRSPYNHGNVDCLSCAGAGVVDKCPRCDGPMVERRYSAIADIADEECHVCRACELALETHVPHISERVELPDINGRNHASDCASHVGEPCDCETGKDAR